MSKRHELRRKELMEATLEQAIDYYLGNLQLEGKSPATILWHRKKLTGFKRFMLNQRPSVKVSELDVQDGRAFVHSLQERTTKYSGHKFRQEVMEGLAPQTISSYVRSMRAFASWLWDEGYTEENLFKRLKLPKVPDVFIEPLTEEEIRRILLAIPQYTQEGTRSYAIVTLFLDSGIRLSEFIGLRISHMDFTTGQFKVFGKGSRERLVPMGVTARRAVTRYLQHYRPQPANPVDDSLFLTVEGKPITQDSVEKIIQHWRCNTGVILAGLASGSMSMERKRPRISLRNAVRQPTGSSASAGSNAARQSRNRIEDWLALAKEFHARSALSHRAVAEEADLDHSYVSRLLAGERNPERDVLIALGYAWRVTRADADSLPDPLDLSKRFVYLTADNAHGRKRI